MKRLLLIAILLVPNTLLQARDFENGYAVYAAGSETCSQYLAAEQQGGVEYDYFINWLIGYFSAFNVIMPNTYDILGENEFSMVQNWLNDHCTKFPRELFVNAAARVTEVLYPARYQTSLKNQNPASLNKPDPSKQPAPQRNFSDIKIR
ncbi:MAG: hypothetical protein OQL09_07955 [Gammaproteobacteria bacterium]|nr:hypothetical protein [Gammaproteobacteria bacterium]